MPYGVAVLTSSDDSTSGVAAIESVATVLRERIVDGHYAPGAPLREVSLAQDLGVSRNTLRESLHLLAIENLVEVRRHRGAVVKVMTAEDIRDIYLVRRVLELKAVEESGSADPFALERMTAALDEADRLAAAGHWNEVSTAGLRYHQSLVATLGSPRIDALYVTIVAQMRLAFSIISDAAALQAPFWVRGREILDLVLAGSRTSAAAALRSYLDDSERMLVELIDQQSNGSDRS